MGFEDISHEELEKAVESATEEAAQEGHLERAVEKAVDAAYQEGRQELGLAKEQTPDNVVSMDEARKARDEKIAALRNEAGKAAEEEIRKYQQG